MLLHPLAFSCIFLHPSTREQLAKDSCCGPFQIKWGFALNECYNQLLRDISAQPTMKTVFAAKHNQAARSTWVHLWGSALLLERPVGTSQQSWPGDHHKSEVSLQESEIIAALSLLYAMKGSTSPIVCSGGCIKTEGWTTAFCQGLCIDG